MALKSNLRYGILLITAIILASCNSNGDSGEVSDREPIARVFDKFLYADDVSPTLTSGLSSEDSSKVIAGYIQNWIKQQVLLKKAESNLTEEQKDKEKQVEDYRNSLIIYEYETLLITQKLDTVVSDEEIKKHYEENPKDFELKENIVKMNYVKLAKDVPDASKLWGWMNSNKEADREKLHEFCLLNAENYYLDDSTWLYLNDIAKEISLQYDQSQFLKQQKFFSLQDEEYLYLIKIIDFRIKNSISPLEFERNKIKNIIINKRKVALLRDLELKMMKDAEINNNIEVYK